MAIRNITIYECDICKQRVESDYQLTRIRIPALENENDYYMEDCTSNEQEESIIDCCTVCTEKIAKLLAKNVGYYNLNEDKVTIR